MRNLNELRDKAYQIALDNGWHEKNLSDEHWLCLVISELMEAVEADRIGKYANKDQFSYYMKMKDRPEDEFYHAFSFSIKDTVEDELGDAVIRLLDYCGTINFVIDDSCSNSDAIEDFSQLFKKLTFTESIFHIVESISRFEIQVAFLKIFGFCEQKGIDIFWHIDHKMEYNKLRGYHHGGKKY